MTSTTPDREALLAVTQADRDAARDHFRLQPTHFFDEEKLAQAFARHRLAPAPSTPPADLVEAVREAIKVIPTWDGDPLGMSLTGDEIDAIALAAIPIVQQATRAEVAILRKALTEARDQLWHLAKDPKTNPWVLECDAALAATADAIEGAAHDQ